MVFHSIQFLFSAIVDNAICSANGSISAGITICKNKFRVDWGSALTTNSQYCVLRVIFVGTYKVRNEIETKRNQRKRNQRKRNETKRNQRNGNEMK